MMNIVSTCLQKCRVCFYGPMLFIIWTQTRRQGEMSALSSEVFMQSSSGTDAREETMSLHRLLAVSVKAAA